MSRNIDTKFGLGCLVLFGLPFLLAGLAAGWHAIREFNRGTGDSQEPILLALFSLVFCGAGTGVISLGFWGSRHQDSIQELKAIHPNQPWMWREDWARGRVECSNKRTAVFAWLFALFWNLISAPALFLVPEEVTQKGNQAAWLALLFPLVGLGLLYWAARATVRWTKFGRSTLAMPVLPGVIGGRLAGTIQTRLNQPPPKGVKLTLSSVRVRRSHNRKRSDIRDILWQEEAEVPPAHLMMSPEGVTIPVSFRIPRNCQPTDDRDSQPRHEWKLEAEAEVAGVDYESHFEVPVFVTPSSGADDGAYPEFRSDRAPEFDPREATIPMRPSAGGGIEFYARPARNLGAAMGVTVFFAIWAGAVWLQMWLGAPLFFPVISGLFGVLIFLVVLDQWFGTQRVVLENGEISATGKTLGIGSTKRIPFDAVTDVTVGVGMQQRQSMTQAGRAWYDVSVHPKAGRKKKVLTAIRNKREAEWIAEQIKQRIETGKNRW